MLTKLLGGSMVMTQITNILEFNKQFVEKKNTKPI